MKLKKSQIVCISVCAVILALMLVINIVIGVFAPSLDKYIVGYKDGDPNSATRAKGLELQQQIQEEGTVLVKNKDEQGMALLPLNKTDVPKVNVFGWDATDWVISGSGSGQVKRANSIDLLAALEDYGILYNTDLTDMYEGFRANREFSINGGNGGSSPDTGNDTQQSNAWGALHSFNYEFSRLYEPSIADRNYYTQDILDDAKEFSKTAIVAIGRVSGESNDSPAEQYKQTGGTSRDKGKLPDSKTDKERTYLEISTEEEALLKYVGENYENVIVLINSTNVMELGFMDTIPGLDACLIVSTTGTAGARAIPKIIYGDINPSGKTADTWAYDLSTSSTYVDTGKGNDTTHLYKNAAKSLYPVQDAKGNAVNHVNGSSNVGYDGVSYQDYREGVYMGYKWYETADTMGFWDTEYAKEKWNINNGYKDVVQYPFGYGLSYTNFEWKITYLEQLNGATLSKDDTIKVGVSVKNIGDVAGQDVVELYYTAPYTDGGIEKSSVNLAAFAKTQKVLDPGESEYVELSFKASDMASYDYEGFKINGGGYVLEKGEYSITLRTDAHTLATVVGGGDSVHGNSTITYNVSSDTRVMEEAENHFTGSGATDGVACDGNSDGTADITYMTRANFTGTFPAEFGDNREMKQEIAELNMYKSSMADAWDEQWAQDNPDATRINASGDSSKGQVVGEMTTDENGQSYFALNDYGIRLGLDPFDDGWEELMDRIPKSEMEYVVLHGYTKTMAVPSIGKPKTLDLDGPHQIASFTGGYANKTGFSEIVLAQTWNLELAYSMGLTFGAECAESGISGCYGPGVNVHRSPFGGRNYEYYSEDALLSGLMCAKVVSAAKNRGIYCWLKHICLYEGESGRDGMYTWVTEQALREIYLKPFEIAVKTGGSNAIMTSYGRVGAVWTGGSYALLTEVCRNEWKFPGAFITDYTDHLDYMNGDQMVRAGGDLWMDGYSNNDVGPGSFNCSKDSVAFENALRNSAKHIIYMWMNSLAQNAEYNEGIKNGTIKDSIVIPVKPELNFRWYIPVLVVADVLAFAGIVVWVLLSFLKKKKVKGNADNGAENDADNNAKN